MSRGHSGTIRVAGCVVCGSSRSRQLIAHGRYAILRCGDCSLAYLWPQPCDQEQEELYGESYYKSDDGTLRGYSSYLDQAANIRATFRDRLPFLGRPEPKNRLLDVGAAAGHFIQEAAAVGWRAEGVEYSRWAAEYATRVTGVPVRHGTLESIRYPDNSFDVVTMWEVIEHLRDPRMVLGEIRRILGRGGALHVSTPDAGSVVARLAGKRWLGWRKVPEHLFFFDLPSLTRLLSSEGFELASHRYVSLTVTWHYALERLGTMLGAPVASWVPQAARKRNVRINCFYDLMVTARVR